MIQDQFYVNVGDGKDFHTNCLYCDTCWKVLGHDSSCYERSGMVFCKDCNARYEQCRNKSRIEIKSLKNTTRLFNASFVCFNGLQELQVFGFIKVFFANLWYLDCFKGFGSRNVKKSLSKRRFCSFSDGHRFDHKDFPLFFTKWMCYSEDGLLNFVKKQKQNISSSIAEILEDFLE